VYRVILSPEEIEADQGNSTFGMFFLAFLLLALVAYKSRKKNSS
jgi:LPXTG-motif cell wall-anchored protein